MANEISLVRYAGSLVTPQHDAITADYSTRNNGIYYGCTVTIKNANTLHITAGQGVIYGRQFEIVDSDIPVSLSSSGTLLGQLYVHIDLDNTTEPISLEVETGNSLTPLTDDPLINVSAAVSEMQLATFTVSTSTIASLVTTYDMVDKIGDVLGNTDISAIGDGSVTGAISSINTNLSELIDGDYTFVSDNSNITAVVNNVIRVGDYLICDIELSASVTISYSEAIGHLATSDGTRITMQSRPTFFAHSIGGNVAYLGISASGDIRFASTSGMNATYYGFQFIAKITS